MRIVCSALTILTLVGCANSAATGPSLARRPIESRDLSEPASTAVPAPPADADLAAQIAGLRNRAEQGQSDFEALAQRAGTAAAAAGPAGSESWITAQQLLTALEAVRGPTADALARTDALLAQRVLAGSDQGLAELQAAQREIAALAEAQRQQIEALQARINR